MSAQLFDFAYNTIDGEADGIIGQLDSYDLFFKANQQLPVKPSEPMAHSGSADSAAAANLPLAPNDGLVHLRAGQGKNMAPTPMMLMPQHMTQFQQPHEHASVDALGDGRKRGRDAAADDAPLVGTVPIFTEEERKERRRLQNRLAQRRSRARKRARLTGEVYDESAMVFEEEADLRRLDARLRAAEAGEPLIEYPPAGQPSAAPAPVQLRQQAAPQTAVRPAAAPQTATPQAAYSHALASLAPPAKAVAGPASVIPHAAASLLSSAAAQAPPAVTSDEGVVPSVSPKVIASMASDADVETLRNMAASPEMEIFRSRFRLFYVDLRTVSFFEDLGSLAKAASISSADLFLLAAASAACSRWLGSPAEAQDFARIARRFTDMQADERNCVANLLLAYMHVDAGETVAATQYAAIAKTSCTRQDMHASCDFVSLTCSPSEDRRNEALQSLGASPLAEAVVTANVAGASPADAAVYASIVRTIPGIVGSWLLQRTTAPSL